MDAPSTTVLGDAQELLTGAASFIAWARFDAGWYGRTYSCEAATALEFYLSRGHVLGHSPNPLFDEKWYLREYPEVELAVETGEYESGFDEYCQRGWRDRSPHWLFDDTLYRTYYADLDQATLERAGFANRYDHFLRAGSHEGRIGHLFFDPGVWRAHASPAADDASPFVAFLCGLSPGVAEPRVSWYFDPGWFLAAYPDVAEAVAAGRYRCALHAYLADDRSRGRNPLPEFDAAYYLDRYDDVAASVGPDDARAAWRHFLASGVFEFRAPSEVVDLRYYGAAYARVAEDIAAGQARDAFSHFLAIGRPAGLRAEMPREELPDEPHARALFRARAENNLRAVGRHPLDFTVAGEVTPDVSVIMVLHDQFALSMQALSSLRASHGGPIELIVVDSGSTDDTRHFDQYVRGAIVLRFDVNIGFVRGCNAGLLSVSAPAVLFINNDVTVEPGAIKLGLARLAADPAVGAVGGKIIRSHGALQEAGCIVWSNGFTSGYARDRDPLAPEANFARRVDFCSGAFLLVRASAVAALDGFDEAFAPAYYEETDLCIRLAASGLFVLYDPDIVVTHLEFGSGGHRAAESGIGRSHRAFVAKHRDWLRTRPPQPSMSGVGSGQPPNGPAARRDRTSAELAARGCAYSGPRSAAGRLAGLRVLFIEDQVPLRLLGSGFVRSNDILSAMASDGAVVTLFPMNGCSATPAAIHAAIPDSVETLHDRDVEQLDAFLAERAGLFDVVWIARTHNLMRARAALSRHATDVPRVLDTEAVVAARDAVRAELDGKPFDLSAAVGREFAQAGDVAAVLAVSDAEADLLRAAGMPGVAVLGHASVPRPTPRPFAERTGMLFIGAIHRQDSPNLDSLLWFADAVLPLVEAELGWETRLTVVGHQGEGIDLGPLAKHMRITVRGAVADTLPLYDQARVFVAPTRFAAGIPYKIHEAGSFGVPVVTTDLIAAQVGWRDGDAILCAPVTDPAGLAARIVRLHRDEALWHRIRDGALGRLAAENSETVYADTIATILREAVRSERERSARPRSR